MLHWGAGRRFVRWAPSGTPAGTLIGAMTPAPDATRQTLITSTVDSLIAAGVWPKLDMFFITAAHAAQPALLDWCNPYAIGLIATNSPAFVIDRGYTGDGTTSGVQTTGRNVSTLTSFLQDSASMWAWSRTDGTGTGADFGTVGASNSFSIIRSASNNNTQRLNTNTTASVANAGAIGFFGMTRNNSADFQPYKNGAVLGGALAAVSAAPFAGPFSLCKGQASFSVRQMAAGGCGGYLTPTEWLALYNAVAAYMTAVGA
jgi:hypothetical protein